MNAFPLRRPRGADTRVDWYEGARHQDVQRTHEPPSTWTAIGVHGFLGTPYDLRGPADELFGAGIDLSLPALPGFGADGAHIATVRSVDWRRTVADAWRNAGGQGERRMLAGYSLGGTLAILQAVDDPPDALVLIAPLTRIDAPGAWALPLTRHIFRWWRPFAGAHWNDDAYRAWWRALAPDIPVDDPDSQRLLSDAYAIPTRMITDMQALCRRARAAGPRLRCPTWIYQGTRDDVVSAESAHAFAASVPNLRQFRALEGGHYLSIPAFPAYEEFSAIFRQDIADMLENTD